MRGFLLKEVLSHDQGVAHAIFRVFTLEPKHVDVNRITSSCIHIQGEFTRSFGDVHNLDHIEPSFLHCDTRSVGFLLLMVLEWVGTLNNGMGRRAKSANESSSRTWLKSSQFWNTTSCMVSSS